MLSRSFCLSLVDTNDMFVLPLQTDQRRFEEVVQATLRGGVFFGAEWLPNHQGLCHETQHKRERCVASPSSPSTPRRAKRARPMPASHMATNPSLPDLNNQPHQLSQFATPQPSAPQPTPFAVVSSFGFFPQQTNTQRPPTSPFRSPSLRSSVPSIFSPSCAMDALGMQRVRHRAKQLEFHAQQPFEPVAMDMS